MREVAGLSGLEAPVGAIADDATPVLVFLAELSVLERVENRLAAATVALERAQHVRRDLAALEQVEPGGEQVFAAVVVRQQPSVYKKCPPGRSTRNASAKKRVRSS